MTLREAKRSVSNGVERYTHRHTHTRMVRTSVVGNHELGVQDARLALERRKVQVVRFSETFGHKVNHVRAGEGRRRGSDGKPHLHPALGRRNDRVVHSLALRAALRCRAAGQGDVKGANVDRLLGVGDQVHPRRVDGPVGVQVHTKRDGFHQLQAVGTAEDKGGFKK